VQAVLAAEFAAWVEATRNKGPILDAASYVELSKQSLNTAPFTYGSADPKLFQQIVMQQLPPGPGPEAGTPNRDVSPRTEP
jgi:cytochrome o ubiquinol oxidase subunit 2